MNMVYRFILEQKEIYALELTTKTPSPNKKTLVLSCREFSEFFQGFGGATSRRARRGADIQVSVQQSH
jgi:hypothetical protein